ncbi:MAG: polysaccharide biosynthesis C-terminal domain-containing protein [Fervidobacterium sp.]
MKIGVARNYVYNTMITILNILFPFITVPYITRVLEPQSVGSIAFTSSIVQWFAVFAELGFYLFGVRRIASVRKDIRMVNIEFSNIVFAKSLSFIAVFIMYVLFVIFFGKKYFTLFVIQSIMLVNVPLDITFLYAGIEDFKQITLRSLIMRSVGLLLLFLLVKRPEDYLKYALISVLTTFFGNIWMWSGLKRRGMFLQKPELSKIKYYFVGTLKLFIPILAIQIYAVLDKTMVGILSAESEVAYYDLSQRLVKISLGLVTSLGPVMLSKMSHVVSEGIEEVRDKYIKYSFEFMTYAAVLIIVMIITTMQDFVPFFFGSKYTAVKNLIVYISPIILFIAWSNLIGIQVMLPLKKESYLTLSVFVGAISNFTLNLILIPKYRALGAVIATDVAEFMVTFVQIILIRRLIDVGRLFKDVWKHFLAGTVTFGLLMVLSKLPVGNAYQRIALNILSGTIFYILIQYLLRSEINGIILKKLKATVSRIFG